MLRNLTSQEIDNLIDEHPAADANHVAAFLEVLGNNPGTNAAISNAANTAALYKWTQATVAAVAHGIRLGTSATDEQIATLQSNPSPKLYAAGIDVQDLAGYASILRKQECTLQESYPGLLGRLDALGNALAMFARSNLATPDWLLRPQDINSELQLYNIGVRLTSWLYKMTGRTLLELQGCNPSTH